MQEITNQKPRVCFVTEELAGVGGSGGIGAAFLELAKLLARQGMSVDVVYCPVAAAITADEVDRVKVDFLKLGIKVLFLNPGIYVSEPFTCEKKSYAIAQHLMEKTIAYDFIHFHDYKGLGFFSAAVKKQGLGLKHSKIIVQLHGPARWTKETNNTFFSHEDQLKVDFMEKESIAMADVVVSPSQYLVSWLNDNHYLLPSEVKVIKNVCSDLAGTVKQYHLRQRQGVSDVILFARHEDRKGFSQFCDALDLIAEELYENNVTVSFLGKFGQVNSQPSGIYLIDRAKKWNFPISIRTGLARNGAASFITSRSNPIVVIPSPAENSPYTVLEAIMMGVPIISSINGGGPELFDDLKYEGLTEITAAALAQKISYSIKQGIPQPKPSESIKEIENQWIHFHEEKSIPINAITEQPLVTFAITHYERAAKLVDAICSVIQQTYQNIEVLVVDDGSSNPDTLADLEKIEILLSRVGGRLIRQENGYLGAARNCAIRHAKGTYICFLDDDDIAKPELIDTLLTAAQNTNADVVNCMNIYMDEKVRGDVLARTPNAPTLVGYVPLGGPLALSPMENSLGAATALFKKSALLDIGGYTELKGVGHEDYELFMRLLQANKKLIIVPKALYYYEVGRPSMLSRTNLIANFRRCFDSLDINLNTQAWKDLIDLQMGKMTHISAHNRQYWLFTQASNSELRLKILTNDLSRKEGLEALIDLAKAENSLNIERALIEDLTSNNDELLESDYAPVKKRFLKSEKDFVKSAGLKSRIVDAQFNIAINRFEDAVVEYTEQVKLVLTLDSDDVLFINHLLAISGNYDVDAMYWENLYDAILQSVAPKSEIDNIELITLKLLILSNKVEPARSEVERLLEQQEVLYLNQNQDVAQAIVPEGFKSGLHHYMQCGKEEGRIGFLLYNDIAEFLKDHSLYSEIIEEKNFF